MCDLAKTEKCLKCNEGCDHEEPSELRIMVNGRRCSNSAPLVDQCYRTVNGAHYVAWLSCPSADRIAAYRAAGARVRRFGDELYVHHMDDDICERVDAELGDSHA